jgi:hypothetical protein
MRYPQKADWGFIFDLRSTVEGRRKLLSTRGNCATAPATIPPQLRPDPVLFASPALLG